ncbi:MAG: taurine dioxygenase [Paracrocinitomix sp.]|jgi:taurine dioxygenase
MTLEVTPLTPILGAEVSGLNVLELDDEQFAELFDVFTRHSVIFLRDQPAMTEQEHYEFAGRFGQVHVHPFAREAGPDPDKPFPGLIRMRTTEDSRVAAGNRWHSDVSCDDRPPQASILQLHQVPAVGGDTLFASLYAAYDALSPQMKQYLDGMTAHHSGEESYRKLFQMKTAPGSAWPEANHPIVRRHPDSGRPALFVDREFTESINNLPKEEGRALLDFLFAHTERANFQCRFRWTQNAIAIWDNRCALHHAMWDYWPAERSGHRVSVQGEVPLLWNLALDQAPSNHNDTTVRLTA